MKKLFLVLLVLATAFAGNAQRIFFYGGNLKTTDTLTNTTSKYLTTRSGDLQAQSPYGGYDIQLNLINITGTSATQTWVLQSSLDGVLYSNHFKNAGTNGVGCDTLVTGSIGTSGATYQHIWTVITAPFGYNATSGGTPTAQIVRQSNSGRRHFFRILCIPTGTHTTSASASLIIQN